MTKRKKKTPHHYISHQNPLKYDQSHFRKWYTFWQSFQGVKSASIAEDSPYIRLYWTILYEAAVSYSKLTLCDRSQHVDVNAEKRPPTPSAQRKLSPSIPARIPPGEPCKNLGRSAPVLTHDGIPVHACEKWCWVSARCGFTGAVASRVNTVLLHCRVVSPRSLCFRQTCEFSLCGIRSTGAHSGIARALRFALRKFNSYSRELTIRKRAFCPVESSWQIMCFSLTVKWRHCAWSPPRRALTAHTSLRVYKYAVIKCSLCITLMTPHWFTLQDPVSLFISCEIKSRK